jgi:Tfp pilus assembly PilM family ATPase
MTGFDTTAGIKVTSSKIQLVELSIKSGVVLVKDLNEVFFNEKIDFQKDKETKISALLQGAYDEVLLQRPLKDIYVSICVPLSLTYSIQTGFEESLLYSDLIEQFRWELSLLYPYQDAKELIIQYYPVASNEFVGNNSAYVTAVPRHLVNIFNTFCRDNNLHLRFIDSSHTASDKALVTNIDITREKLLLSLLIEDKTLSFIFYSQGEPFLFRSKQFGNASEIPDLVNNEVIKNNFGVQINKAYITGDEISNTFIEKLSNKTNIPFIRFNPFSKLQLDPLVLENKYYLLKNSSFSPAVGISIRSF